MLKAVAIIKFESAFGELTVAVTKKNEIMFRANEVAKILGYSDTKGCIRQYAEDAELIVMPTAGGNQPVKCISWRDLMHIGIKSRLPGKEDLLFELSHFHKSVKIDILEKENTLLKNHVTELLKTLDKSIAITEKTLSLVDRCIEKIKILLAEQQESIIS